MVDFGLDEDYEALRSHRRGSSRATSSRHRSATSTSGTCSPSTSSRQMGAHGAVRSAVPRGARRDGRRLLRPRASRSRSSPASTRRWPSRSRRRSRLGAMPLHRFGSQELKDTWLPRLTSGEAIGAFGLTEPGGGTDAGATRTTARLDGDALGDQRQQGVHHQQRHRAHRLRHRDGGDRRTRRTAARRSRRSSCRPGRPGSRSGRPTPRSAGAAPTPTSSAFVDCRVPAGNLVGELGRGYAQFLADPRRGPHRHRRPVGRARPGLRRRVRALRAGARGLRLADRDQPGPRLPGRRPRGARPHGPARVLRRRARGCSPADPFKRQAAIAKLVASEAAMDNARVATQVFGGYGFMNDYRRRPVLPRRQGARDRRGDVRGPAHAHRTRPGPLTSRSPAGLVPRGRLLGQPHGRLPDEHGTERDQQQREDAEPGRAARCCRCAAARR